MTPIVIYDEVQDLEDAVLLGRLNYHSYQFCVNADFTNEVAITRLVKKLEMLTTEALLRIFEDEFGYRPFQNKIYEKTEKVFLDQDAYNINRMMSSLRRSKIIPIDAQNEKYIKWMKNRIKYGVKAITTELTVEEEAQATA